MRVYVCTENEPWNQGPALDAESVAVTDTAYFFFAVVQEERFVVIGNSKTMAGTSGAGYDRESIIL